MKSRTLLPLLLLAAALGQSSAAQPTAILPTRDNYLRVAAEVEASLFKDDLDKFFPAAVDPNGGFFENFTEDWSHPTNRPDTTRSVVYQSRLTWLAAQAAMRYPDKAATYLLIVRHGAQFLAEKQWDADHGGFWWAVDTAGHPSPANSKHAYGNAFAIYALTAAYEATHDDAMLDLARKSFQWFDAHAHDDAHGGYFEQLRGDGSHLSASDANGRGNGDVLGARPGQKSMNAHIHILEAFTALLESWPDPLLKKRTEEIYQLNLTKIYTDPGRLHLFFADDWTHAPGRDSYGHDIEAAYLFAEAAAALGKPDDPACWTAGKKIVDHCLAVAYDPAGSLNSEGDVDGSNPDRSRVWWVQAESLNALLLMHDRFGKDDPRYWNAFINQWNFITAHQIDPKNGGWYSQLNPDNTPTRFKLAKTDAWTEGYHQGRAMLTVSARLKQLAANAAP